MKGLIRITIILALMAVLAISMFPVGMTTITLPGLQPNVGWNTGVVGYAPTLVAATGITVKPCIGWNT